MWNVAPKKKKEKTSSSNSQHLSKKKTECDTFSKTSRQRNGLEYGMKWRSTALRDFLDISQPPLAFRPRWLWKIMVNGKKSKIKNKKKRKQEGPAGTFFIFFFFEEIHCEAETSRDKIIWAGHISRTNGGHFHYKFHSAFSWFSVRYDLLICSILSECFSIFTLDFYIYSHFRRLTNISIRLSARNYGQNNIYWTNSREENKIKPRDSAMLP